MRRGYCSLRAVTSSSTPLPLPSLFSMTHESVGSLDKFQSKLSTTRAFTLCVSVLPLQYNKSYLMSLALG